MQAKRSISSIPFVSGSGGLVEAQDPPNIVKHALSAGKKLADAITKSLKPKPSKVQTLTLPGHRFTQLSNEEKAHDEFVRNEVALLDSAADSIEERKRELEQAKIDFVTAATCETHKATETHKKACAYRYEQAMRAKAERHRLIEANPRAYGKPW